ncbi:MAG: biotin carboxylase N-terminal domain-containing protein [Burkholderiaceae bacterium]|nr:biotin carboxylase N-terminal domain-containing protein [Burkholderiaceae bacterium]MDZ4143628.1 biotin carboxylase N-terminal domain-containing protein [Burkholderiales bacterium]
MKKLLIANRSEIARRIIRTAHAMGIHTVAVYSDTDADALYVAEATQAVALGGNASSDTYLRVDKLLAAAAATGADGVHPGYGFLSENADFAQAVLDAGLIWVGPPPGAIRQLGSKSAAKALAQTRGVPCLPGYFGADQSGARLVAEAQRIGLPLMVKAVAGGGGRGMRLVTDMAQFEAAVHSARSEAQAAFGSGELLLERALLNPRHVEVQIFADTHGQCIHLGERDCSVQRRHQKLIEETPSPAVNDALRARMGRCAVELAQAAGYVGAGTVEFLLDCNDEANVAGADPGAKAPPEGSTVHATTGVGAFYLMEMNTRLQVEHPVTEAVTGLDLVEWQLRVARGEPLPLAQEQVRFNGHAIEVRLCAEDEDFNPHTGTVQRLQVPHGVRFDHALREGLAVPPYYDSMLGKLVAHAPTRAVAIEQLAGALDRTQVLGLPTNRAFLAACLRHPVFCAGDAVIPFLAVHAGSLRQAILNKEQTITIPCGLSAIFIDNFAFSAVLNCPYPRPVRLRLRGAMHDWRLSAEAGGTWRLETSAQAHAVTVSRVPGGAIVVTVDGVQTVVHGVRRPDGRWHVQAGGADLMVDDASFEPPVGTAGSATADELRAPFNGKVLAVRAAAGDRVQRGAPLVVLESMKLEHSLCAARDGVLAQVRVAVGQQVAPGQVLVQLRAEGT